MSDLNFLKQLRQKLESLSNQTTSESKGDRDVDFDDEGWANDARQEKERNWKFQSYKKPAPKKTDTETAPIKKTNESVDPKRIRELADKLENGEITYDEFRSALDKDEYTDYSMRQGEMGNPDARSDLAWGREKDEWDQEDQYNDEQDAARDGENEWERQDRLEREREDAESPYNRYEESDEHTLESIRRAAPVITECGEMAVGAPQQTNSSTVNISFNGSGPQGIRDIMNVLRDIEDEMQQSSDSSNDDHEGMEMPIVIKPHDEEPEGDEFEEDYANSPDEEYHDVDDVINPPSNDLNSPHKSYKHNPLGGDNKMAESLSAKLQEAMKKFR